MNTGREKDRIVIAISGPSGAGKTSLVNSMGAALEDSVTIFFDYYESIEIQHPDQTQWIQEGCDPNTWVRIPQLVNDLRALKQGRSIVLPEGDHYPANVPRKRRIHPTRRIILEEPWGRDRQEIRPLIDLVIHIDIPLDVSLCRRMIRDAAYQNPWDRAQEYLRDSLHEFYKRQQQVGENADLVLDGMKSVEELTEEVVEQVEKSFPL